MAHVTVRVPAVLAAGLGGRREVDVPYDADAGPPSVRRLLDVLAEEYPRFGRRVRDERGEVRRYVNVFVGADNIRDLSGQDTAVPAGTDVLVVQSVAGG
ncbi:MoaD/ThiS family protein [Zhihengliuella sp.]|uniref:MoaD/ThiS family protein n=1 Tax=Zhihengliuella sp. TaxID=1954483 RepID=UPI002811BCB3|nr:MoaD/ThiS family protein [Zhihengliuella sp.]